LLDSKNFEAEYLNVAFSYLDPGASQGIRSKEDLNIDLSLLEHQIQGYFNHCCEKLISFS
jgi:hypothetical protein